MSLRHCGHTHFDSIWGDGGRGKPPVDLFIMTLKHFFTSCENIPFTVTFRSFRRDSYQPHKRQKPCPSVYPASTLPLPLFLKQSPPPQSPHLHPNSTTNLHHRKYLHIPKTPAVSCIPPPPPPPPTNPSCLFGRDDPSKLTISDIYIYIYIYFFAQSHILCSFMYVCMYVCIYGKMWFTRARVMERISKKKKKKKKKGSGK